MSKKSEWLHLGNSMFVNIERAYSAYKAYLSDTSDDESDYHNVSMELYINNRKHRLWGCGKDYLVLSEGSNSIKFMMHERLISEVYIPSWT